MKTRFLLTLMFIGVLTVGCGSGDDSKAVDAVSDAAHSAKESAEAVVDDATDAAHDAMADNPVKRCMELATEKNWADALAPCTEAAKQMPDDLGIRHALQQAQAAAEG